jgi:Zn-finger nucleic acid-binding protein
MLRCPMCDSARIVVVIDTARRAFCTKCGARWIQDGSLARKVRRGLFRARMGEPERAPGS